MEEKQDIAFYVLSGALIMITIAFMVIYLVIQQRKKFLLQQNEIMRVKNETEQNILKAVIKTQEEERSRIASSLHDSVGAELSMLKINLGRYIYSLKGTGFDTNYLVSDIDNLNNTIETIRAVCRNLYPSLLENYGFIKIYGEICQRLDATGQINCYFNSSITEEEIGPDFSFKLDLFRICQEILNNIIKHAACANLQISVMGQDKIMTILFRHDGKGFSNNDAEQLRLENKGIGLSSIKNRISLIGGKIDYFSRDNGSDIKIELPV